MRVPKGALCAAVEGPSFFGARVCSYRPGVWFHSMRYCLPALLVMLRGGVRRLSVHGDAPRRLALVCGIAILSHPCGRQTV